MKKNYTCEQCGAVFIRYPSQVKGKRHVFCSLKCLAAYKKAGKYSAVKRPDLSEYNRKHNKDRMTLEVREKLRQAQIDTGDGKSYRKYFVKHEHRVIAEQILGRKLHSGEIVHHINRDKRDNRPENLIIFPSQAEHAKWHKEHDQEEVIAP